MDQVSSFNLTPVMRFPAAVTASTCRKSSDSEDAGSSSTARRCDAPRREPISVSEGPTRPPSDRKSTRLNSSHGYISYAVFCLKKKKPTETKSLVGAGFWLLTDVPTCV